MGGGGISYLILEKKCHLLQILNGDFANRNKSRLLLSSAEMFKKPLLQTVWTQIRLCSGSTLFASILKLVSNVTQLFAADDFSRRHFSDAFFLGGSDFFGGRCSSFSR